MEELKISKVDLEILENKQLSTLFNTSYITNYTLEVIHKSDNYYKPVPEFHYFFRGSVLEYTTGVSREIFAFSSDSGFLVGKCSSDNFGNFYLPVATSGSCFLVAFSENPNFNHLIAAKVFPTT